MQSLGGKWLVSLDNRNCALPRQLPSTNRPGLQDSMVSPHTAFLLEPVTGQTMAKMERVFRSHREARSGLLIVRPRK